MFVFLKIILFFSHPLVWIITIFLFAQFAKKEVRKKTLNITGIVLLLFFTNPYIIRKLIQWYEIPPVNLKADEQFNAGIVLGGFVSYNKTDDKGYFNPAADRFIQTALLYKTGHIKKIIVSAGNGYLVKHDFKEAVFIKDHLIVLGIPSSVIYTDPFSRNTEENVLNTGKIIDSIHVNGPFLLISSALHLPRAIKLFRKQGINTKPYPCDFSSKNRSNNIFEDYILPSSSALRDWDSLIKEAIGTISYKLTGKI